MSRGPVLNQPVSCSSLELKDLADVEDFELIAEVGVTYGFEFSNSVYKRKEIEANQPRKLEQLRNVEADLIENHEYKLLREGNQWLLIPVHHWEIKFTFESPCTYFFKNKTFRKSFNTGPTLVTFGPGNNSKGEIEVLPHNKTYFLHRKDSVTKDAITDIQFIPQQPLHKTFTMVFELFAKERSGPVVGVSMALMQGIRLVWDRLDQDTLRVNIIIQKTPDGIGGGSTSDKVTVSVNEQQLTNLSTINITHVDLIGFYYSEEALSQEFLQKDFKIN